MKYSSPLSLQQYAPKLSASLGLASAQFDVTPFELRNLDPDNLQFTEQKFEEAESSDSDDLTLATLKNIVCKESQATC